MTDYFCRVVTEKKFLVYTLLQPMSYVPIFCQNKDLIKIHYCGKHKYSICRCQVINFQSFAYQFSPFWEVLGSKLHQIWFSFTETL